MTASRDTVLRKATWPPLLAAAAWSGFAFYFSTAANTITPLAWVAPSPVLAFVFARAAAVRAGDRKQPGAWLRIGLAAFLAAFCGNLAWVALYRGILPMPGLVSLALVLGAAFAGVARLTGLVASRVGTPAGVVFFPALWVAVELAFARLSPHGTAGSLAYTQVDILPLVQLAAWAGLAAITFVVYLVASGIAALLGDRGPGGLRWRLIVVPAVVLVVALVAGQWRVLNLTRVGRVVVGLVSMDEGMRHSEAATRDEALAVLLPYLESAGALAARGAEAVVLPEKLVGIAPVYEDEATSLLSSLAGKDGIALIAGLNKVGRDGKRNVADVFARGRRVLEYEKQRLVPGLEAGYARGRSPGIYRAPGGVTGIAICKDLDFPEIGREYGRAGVGLLFVPAWDFTRDGRLHSRMALMRGVEGGYSVARAAANGLLTGSDYLGRIIAERPSDAAPASMLVVELPLGRGRTLYSRYGDWFGWLNVVLAAGLIVLAATRPSSVQR
jgi:apolipoprotein N-acyltransferase